MTKKERKKLEKDLAHKIYLLQHPELWTAVRADKEKSCSQQPFSEK